MISGNELLSIITRYERDIKNPSFYVGRNIPEKKGRNAVQSYGDNGIEIVYALYDGTIFGSAKEGLMFTERSLFYHYLFNKWVVDYDEIDRLEIGKGNTDCPDPKSDILYILTRRGEYKLEISNLDKRILRSMLEDICGLRYSGPSGGYDWHEPPRYNQRFDCPDHRGYESRYGDRRNYNNHQRHDDERRFDERHERYPDRYDDWNHRR